MDYEKKYKEAIKRAYKLTKQNPFDTISQMMEHVFPELKESEDERIRKEITEFILWALDRGSITECQREKSNSWIAWLEKQGEQKHQFKPFDRVLVRDHIRDEWKCDIFSHYHNNSDGSTTYICVGAPWMWCIPFEGNEELVGTTNEPKGGEE